MKHRQDRGDDRLQIESAPRSDGLELQLTGELTLATVSDLEERLGETEPALLVLDLRRVRFADSTALAAIVAADTRSRTAGRRLVLVTAPGPVERLLALSGLDRRLETATLEP